MKNNDPLVSVQGQFNPNFTTISSRYKVKIKNNDPLVSVPGQNEEQRLSRLSTMSLQSKIYDPLVLVQGQNKKKNTLSSQYKVTSIQNLQPSRLSTRSK